MDDELRFKKMELAVHHLNRRVADTEKDVDMLAKILEETRETNKLIGEVVAYAQKTYEVVRPMSKLSVGVIKVGAAALVVWHGVKWLLIKLAIAV